MNAQPKATKTDTHPTQQLTLRTWKDENGKAFRWDVFHGGWKAGQYKTEAGAIRAVNRLKKQDEAAK